MTYRNSLQIPKGISASDSDAARETLGGAFDVAAGLPPALGEQLSDAARAAFSHGADRTSLVGAVIVCASVIITAVALRSKQKTPA